MKKVYILVPGINTRTSDAENWAPMFATEVMVLTDWRADEFRYFAGALTRRLHQQERAEEVARLIQRYLLNGYQVGVVAHSNGNDLVCRALNLLPDGRGIEDFHLVAAACEASFRDYHAGGNGLNAAIASSRVKLVVIYASRNDEALAIWARASRVFRFAGLGYGTIGLEGPKDLSEMASARTVVFWGKGKHSDVVAYGRDQLLQKMRTATQRIAEGVVGGV